VSVDEGTMTDFDHIVERRGANSYKWDGSRVLFGPDGILSFWVADMDFPVAGPILDAMATRAQHPVFGYELRGDVRCDGHGCGLSTAAAGSTI
jgi:bifunctional pyridoxal-dependent enzyme with beta-cystathionase and maltose regulon repressor activities